MTKIADNVQNLYMSYKPELYNLTNARFLEDINQTLSNRKLKWSERLNFLESTINEHRGSFGSVELKYIVDLQNMLSQYDYIKRGKVANADYVKNYLAISNKELEEKHKIVSYNEAYEDLEDKVKVVPIPQATEGKKLLFGRRGGNAKDAKEIFLYTLSAITIGALCIAGSSLHNAGKRIVQYENRIKQVNDVNKMIEDKYKSKEAENKNLEEQVKKLACEKEAMQMQLAALNEPQVEIPIQQTTNIDIPKQGSAPKTNFIFGHETENTLKKYSVRERYAMERIATAMDYKDPAKALRSMKRAEDAVIASRNQILINYYNDHLALLKQVKKEEVKQKPMSDDEKYKIFFNTIPPSQQQPVSSTKIKAKTLEAKIKQEGKGKKTFLQKTGDFAWNYTPISLVSIPEWFRHPWRQFAKVGELYLGGKWFGWWGKHAGGGAVASGGEIIGPGGG